MKVVKCKTCKHMNKLTPSICRHATQIGAYKCQRCGVPLKVTRTEPAEPQDEKVACPMCGRKQNKRGDRSVYWCAFCACSFDDHPEENSDAYNDPQKSAEVHERMANRKGGRLNVPKRKTA